VTHRGPFQPLLFCDSVDNFCIAGYLVAIPHDSTFQGLLENLKSVILATSPSLCTTTNAGQHPQHGGGTISGVTTRWDHFPQTGRNLTAHHQPAHARPTSPSPGDARFISQLETNSSNQSRAPLFIRSLAEKPGDAHHCPVRARLSSASAIGEDAEQPQHSSGIPNY